MAGQNSRVTMCGSPSRECSARKVEEQASGWFEPILGADKFMKGETATLEGFKKIDDYRFQIVLKEAYAPFIYHLAVPGASIYSEKLVKAAGDNWKLNPIGTGPFKLKRHVPNTEIIFERNPHYFEKDLPYLFFEGKICSNFQTTR